jgi:hypothetical protein
MNVTGCSCLTHIWAVGPPIVGSVLAHDPYGPPMGPKLEPKSRPCTAHGLCRGLRSAEPRELSHDSITSYQNLSLTLSHPWLPQDTYLFLMERVPRAKQDRVLREVRQKLVGIPIEPDLFEL